MRVRTVEKLIWVLIFGGLFAAGFGVVLDRQGSVLGWPLSVAGGLAIFVGAVLVWLRSRMPS
jgi:hypothetical protein